MKIKLIYLAAGNSRRFSSRKLQNREPETSGVENKLLYLLDEKPMFRHLFDRLVKVCQKHPEWEIILVTQYPAIEHQVKVLQKTEQQTGSFQVKTVISKDSCKGVSYSIKAGIRAAGNADAYAFFVADQPYFSKKSVEDFLGKMEREAKDVPGCVTWNGREGNPVWFPAKYGKELLELEGDAGGRKVFGRYREEAVFYEVSREEELADIDYMPDAEKMQVTAAKRENIFRVYGMENGKLQKKESLRSALDLGNRMEPRIAAVGAGGKTSLLKQLLIEYKEQNAEPVLVTTTHMKKEAVPYFTTEDSIVKILEVCNREGMVIAGLDAGGGRIKSLSEPVMEKIWELPVPVLVEADGARMLPVKVPGEQEPVIPKKIRIVLSVYGLDAVGQRIKDCCFRPELTKELLGKDEEEILTEEDLALLAVSESGGKKKVLPGMDYYIVLNKADDEKRLEMAGRIALRLEQDFGEKVRITSFR